MTMASLKIPISSSYLAQTFTLLTEVDGENRKFIVELRFMDKLGYWSMNVKDPSTLAYYLVGVPLLPGIGVTANLFRQFSHKLIGSFYVIGLSDDINSQHPDQSNLGTEWMLVWGDTSDTASGEADY
jgi:hypothetical protein